MILKKWKDIPEELKNSYTEKYYKILEKKKIQLILKRIFDIIFSLLLLIILSPIFLILSIAIKIDSKGPVFYRQERVTQYGKIFRIFKFRTMVQHADKKGTLVTIDKDPRVTKIGSKIRKYRLDELPQLINVLMGDMSFVGTRPEVKKYVDSYTEEMKATLLMPAGITSKASIEFKDEDNIIRKAQKNHTIEEAYIKEVLPRKMQINLECINNFSILEDLKVCLKTIGAVLK